MLESSTNIMLTAEYHTLGCKLNFAETSTIATQLEAMGVIRTSTGQAPDFVVVNSCSVTAEADKKCRHLIRRLGRKYPHSAIIVTGCYAQLKSHEVASMPNVAVIAGNDVKDRIGNMVEQWRRSKEQTIAVTSDGRRMQGFCQACSRGDRTRYFLKVQDGCDYFCTYCTIPLARGRSRSASIESVVSLAEGVAAEGGKEIVITGVNIGDYGKGTDETFFDLIRALDKVEGIERYRISSIEPNLLTDEMIEWCAASKRFMPHFHIPLQAGSDAVLRLMHRRYDTDLFRHRVETIRRVMPDAFIGVDIIAGARGETPELFEESIAFVESLDISRLHVFPYSERPGTRALDIDYVVSQQEKHHRVSRLMELSERKLTDFNRRFIGSSRPVLIEHALREGGSVSGFTDNYLRLRLPVEYADRAGDIVLVNINESMIDNNHE